MQRVDFTGLSKSCFAGMVEQMLLALNIFASHGSGWAVDSIENIELKLARSKPIAASSYLALPSELAKCQYLLTFETDKTRNVSSTAIQLSTITHSEPG